jgi:2-keto-4-pentenoate hydratase/2-oxohepta-3-ene-1,7-dioic acid hydratase in catechol pathway
VTGAVPSGTVFGTLLNFRGELHALGGQVNEPPYGAPPKAPVLYIKTANTFSADGAAIVLPAGVAEVEVGATVAMEMGPGGELAGYRLMNDLSLPHASLFRPPVKFKCLDGFLGVGPHLLAAAAARRLPTRASSWSKCGSTANCGRPWTSRAWCARPPSCWPTSANSRRCAPETC